MEVDQKQFELIPSNPKKKIFGSVISKKRTLIGRSESCDLVINDTSVSAIHAVLEINGNRARIYDMNSTNGTKINNKKVIVEEFGVGTKVKFANIEFVFNKYSKKDIHPPILDMLEPAGIPLPIESGPSEIPTPPFLESDIPVAPTPPKRKKKKTSRSTPKAPKKLPTLPRKSEIGQVPRVSYPLAIDAKAEFSEYIFEDVDTLYPIFDYDSTSRSVEVILMFKDTVYAVEFIPFKKGTYYFSGKSKGKNDIEYPYWAKDERLPILDIDGNDVIVTKPFGFEHLYLSDDYQMKDNKAASGPFIIKQNEILHFSKEDFQIFIRVTPSPPSVQQAPMFRRDKTLRGYLMVMTFFVVAFSLGMNLIKIEKKEEEKKPERIAKILYKKKIYKPKVPKSPVKQVKKIPPKPKESIVEIKNKPIPKPQPKQAAKKDFKKIVKNPRKGTPPKSAQNKPATTSKSSSKSAGKSKTRPRFSKTVSKNQGRVDTYKAINFKSTISNVLSKGGTNVAVKGDSGGSGANLGTSGLVGTGASSGGLKRAKVSGKIGSLTGSASGKLVGSTDAKGLVDKRTVYTAGIPSETMVLGSMDPDLIRQILRDNIPRFRYCYQKELDSASQEFSGIIKLQFRIGASGHVTKAGVSQASNLPASVKKCVVNVLRGIKFPEPRGGSEVSVEQPFNFYPVRG